jgi:hypothetical protein
MASQSSQRGLHQLASMRYQQMAGHGLCRRASVTGVRDIFIPQTWPPMTPSLPIHDGTLASRLLQPPPRRVTVECVTVR